MRNANLSLNSLLILRQRYLKKDKNGKIIEKPNDLFKRVAKNIALADARYNYPKQINELLEKLRAGYYELVKTPDFLKLARKDKKLKKTEREFYALMANFDFLPNSPTLLNADRKLQQLAACFVLPIEDHIDSIFQTLRYTALIHRTGAGTGFNFSRLRPKGDAIESTGFTSGVVSFMKIFDAATEQIKLGGTLRGANMGILNADHPDIGEFITIKSRENILTNFNVSVAITNDFIDRVKKNKNYSLINPRTGITVKEESAKRIFDMICRQAWLNGDPGVIFIDMINEFNPLPALGKIESTDSCGEQPLLPYEACNLGSINLSNFVEKGRVNYKRLRKTVHIAVHFLDNVIDMCNYPLKKNRNIAEKNRKIGLGIMGFAEALIKLKIPYNSEKGIRMGEKIMAFVSKEADKASSILAETRGVFPNWDKSIYKKKGMKLRNATRTTIAPTGTISIIADTSSSIEPLFALSYMRKTAEGKILHYFDRNLEFALKKKKVFNRDIIDEITRLGSIQNSGQIPDSIKKIFVTGADISPEYHVKMQAAFQKYVDNGISKTVTLPKDSSVEDVKRIFLLAHQLGCKGISIYRLGSREQVIYLSSRRDEQISLEGWIKRK